MNYKEFRVTKITETEEIKCDNCNGEKHIKVEIFDEFLNENKVLAYLCPKCNGMGKSDGETKTSFEIVEEDSLGIFYVHEDEIFYTAVLDNPEVLETHEQGIMSIRGVQYLLYDSQLNTFFDKLEEAEEFVKAETAKL